MTVLDLMQQAAGIPAQEIRDLLAKLAAAAPGLADEVSKLVAALDADLAPEKIASMAALILPEALDILHLKLAGQDHPSDAI